jgi:uncharacterized protein (TIGR00255 family)
MRSMTGYGKGEAALGDLRVCVEIHSVNRKQIDIALNIPRSLQGLEPRIRETLQTRISRGRLNLNVTLTHAAESLAASAIDFDLARVYANEMRKLQAELGLAGDLTLDTLMRAPGVLTNSSTDVEPEAVWPSILSALGAALAALITMREAEGKNLATDLYMRLAKLRVMVEGIRERSPMLTENYRNQIFARLQSVAGELLPGDERLLKEIAIFAEKSDITEELIRLDSHFSQLENLLAQPEPAGRTLEFLIQEISREFNTLSVKSNDAEISQTVVTAKTEIERIREQVQNIE